MHNMSPMLKAPNNTTEYLTPDIKKSLDSLIADKSVMELKAMEDYLCNCRYALDKHADETVTMEDFNKAKKDTSTEIPTVDDEKGEYA